MTRIEIWHTDFVRIVEHSVDRCFYVYLLPHFCSIYKKSNSSMAEIGHENTMLIRTIR